MVLGPWKCIEPKSLSKIIFRAKMKKFGHFCGQVEVMVLCRKKGWFLTKRHLVFAILSHCVRRQGWQKKSLYVSVPRQWKSEERCERTNQVSLSSSRNGIQWRISRFVPREFRHNLGDPNSAGGCELSSSDDPKKCHHPSCEALTSGLSSLKGH